ncbi:GGDEF domain-containing protein [Clostridium thermopalmarium]|uniref:Response regulator PleD n=1 Tax=Clostridium thermopalmarium DSM 5974 TaxID=1121340 RepID=A0A2T0AZK1_9CLOT|nr:GGDEF domain-containing protein [Clostridium thermopalmarium]PRR76626.1 Response regulator PleD [Clostridium thermopalmarium DSM 5974]PVZ28261.1 diguanylate cyclase [Clostridium thermopalmarium DSM 5974]
MKYRTELILFICMILTGLIYGMAFHIIVMPSIGVLTLHCISTGVLFQAINYFVVLIFYKKYASLKQANRLLYQDLEVDNLTGLLNRRAFDNHTKAIKTKDKFSVIFIDIDNFRDFNNKYGHETGDIVLRDVSVVIKSVVDDKGKAYRYGGEEIVIILNDWNKEKAERIAENIRTRISKLHTNSLLSITLSVGVASYPEDGCDVYETIKASDNALLQAKANGKNCVVVFAK